MDKCPNCENIVNLEDKKCNRCDFPLDHKKNVIQKIKDKSKKERFSTYFLVHYLIIISKLTFLFIIEFIILLIGSILAIMGQAVLFGIIMAGLALLGLLVPYFIVLFKSLRERKKDLSVSNENNDVYIYIFDSYIILYGKYDKNFIKYQYYYSDLKKVIPTKKYFLLEFQLSLFDYKTVILYRDDLNSDSLSLVRQLLDKTF